jgi:bifunctional DNA-binding transcriptional regulator/antitoxin component of YhaV-PrlF toxin-antitoxin module
MDRTASLDGKGRVVIPPELRERLGDHITFKQTEGGILLVPGEKEDPVADFLKMIETEPRRKRKPTFPSPAEMKSIWKETV